MKKYVFDTFSVDEDVTNRVFIVATSKKEAIKKYIEDCKIVGGHIPLAKSCRAVKLDRDYRDYL